MRNLTKNALIQVIAQPYLQWCMVRKSWKNAGVYRIYGEAVFSFVLLGKGKLRENNRDRCKL